MKMLIHLSLLLCLVGLSNAELQFNGVEELAARLKSLREDYNKNVPIGSIACTEDTNPSATQYITLSLSNAKGLFSLQDDESYNTSLLLVGNLDYEDIGDRNDFKMTISCNYENPNGQSIPPKTHSFEILVTDANDNDPIFIRQGNESYVTSVNEVINIANPVQGVLIYSNIFVRDIDGTNNRDIIPLCVSLASSPATKTPLVCDEYFHLNSTFQKGAGEDDFFHQVYVYAIKNEYKPFTSLTLEILAMNVPKVPENDITRNSTSQNVLVNVLEVQDSPPAFDQSTLKKTIYENLEPLEIIDPTIGAYDQDVRAPNPIAFELVPDPTSDFDGFDYFTLGSVIKIENDRNYQVNLILKEKVDREQILDNSKNIYVNIKAYETNPLQLPDKNPMNTTATITVNVKDVNDFSPTFNIDMYTIVVNEIQEGADTSGTTQLVVQQGSIELRDSDGVEFNKFEIRIRSSTYSNLFSFDRYNGSGTQIFTLYIQNSFLDYENALPNTVTITLEAKDVDRPDFTSTAVVTVSIQDVNDHAPVFAKSDYFFTFPESVREDYNVGSVSATDRDSGLFGTIAGYVLRESSNTFEIDNQGNIKLLKPVDFETQRLYEFTVTASDSAPVNPRETTVTITVNVTNVIDVAPMIQGSYVCQVFEERTDLQPAIRIEAINREEQGTILFSLRSTVPGGININQYFNINQLSGEFTLRQPLDFNMTSNGTLLVLVRASSANKPDLFSEKYINITVYNLNNHPPVFQPPAAEYRVTIEETRAKGSVVIQLNTTDEDEVDTPGGKVNYQIKSGANDDFAIDILTGVISVGANARLDFDVKKTYEIVVQAIDLGTPSLRADVSVIVSLLDVNNKVPVFENLFYQFQVNESQANLTVVGRVRATDSDSDVDNIAYTIDYSSATLENSGVEPTQNNVNLETIFVMERSTGIIRVNGFITRESFDRVEFVVEAVDLDGTINTPQMANSTVVITVVPNQNPNITFDPPWTVQSKLVVISQPESDGLVGESIYTMRAYDPLNSVDITFFRKLLSSDVGDYFLINGSKIVLKKPLDYEALGPNKEVSVTVDAIGDNPPRSNRATFVFQVNDVNDNAPIFTRTSYNATLKESDKWPKEVLRLTVTDEDSGSFGRSNFTLEGEEGLFIVEKVQGQNNVAVVRVANGAIFDYEENSVYNILVTARDDNGADTGLQTSINVEITIRDVNDNAPEFGDRVYNFIVIDTAPPDTEIGQVLAKDRDTGPAGQVSYAIRPESTYFEISPAVRTSTTIGNVLQIGIISVKREIESFSNRYQFNLTIVATDKGSDPNPLSSTAIVIITVTESVRDPKPKWSDNLPTRVSLPEGSDIGTFVATLTARPANATSSITYRFVTSGNTDGDYNSFSINSTTGVIRTNAELDYEQIKVYQADGSFSAFIQLLILATDASNDTLTNQYLLVVDVLDIDDNDPTFQRCRDKTYPIPVIARVMESLNPGAFVYRVEACDDDEAPNNDVKYRAYAPIPGSPEADLCPEQNEIGSTFQLDEFSGVITTLQSLDREAVDTYLLCIQAVKQSTQRRKRGVSDVDLASTLHDVLFVRVHVMDANDNGPVFEEDIIQKVILSYPGVEISVSEATDADLAPFNDIRYSIESITFTINDKTYNAPPAFRINGNDGTISAGTSNYDDYVGGFFEISIKAEDYNGGNLLNATQKQKIYVTKAANQIRVVLDRPADSGVEADINEMIGRLNTLQTGLFYEVKKISYHVLNNEDDPMFDKTDVCMVVVRDETVLTALDATKFLEQENAVNSILSDYGAREPGPCDPAKSVYPEGWDSYWWVLVAFAIFIFVCVLILIFIILSLYSGYKRYIDTRRTYLVPGN